MSEPVSVALERYTGPAVICDVCGKDMTPKLAWRESIGISIVVRDDHGDIQDAGYLQRQIGPYTLGREYRACWECFFRAYGFRP